MHHNSPDKYQYQTKKFNISTTLSFLHHKITRKDALSKSDDYISNNNEFNTTKTLRKIKRTCFEESG
jgi:hypothetical protein